MIVPQILVFLMIPSLHQRNRDSVEYVKLDFQELSSSPQTHRSHPHRLSAPVGGVQYAIISRYGLHVSHDRTLNTISDSLV